MAYRGRQNESYYKLVAKRIAELTNEEYAQFKGPDPNDEEVP